MPANQIKYLSLQPFPKDMRCPVGVENAKFEEGFARQVEGLVKGVPQGGGIGDGFGRKESVAPIALGGPKPY
jgi:hypothetical protein